MKLSFLWLTKNVNAKQNKEQTANKKRKKKVNSQSQKLNQKTSRTIKKGLLCVCARFKLRPWQCQLYF